MLLSKAEYEHLPPCFLLPALFTPAALQSAPFHLLISQKERVAQQHCR